VQEAIARTELSLAWQRTTSPGHPALLPPPEWGGVNAVTAGLIELPGRGERRPFISGRAWRTRAGSTEREIMSSSSKGSQTGSQRRQMSGDIRRQPAMVCAARWPIRPRLATCSDAANAPEKRKVGGSTPPLTTTLTCVDVCLATVRAQFATLVVSFLGHLPQADARTSTHSRRSQPHLLVQSAWDAAAAHSSSSPSPSSNRMIRMPSSLRPAGRPWRARRISRGYDLGGRPVRVARLLALSVRWGDGKQSSL